MRRPQLVEHLANLADERSGERLFLITPDSVEPAVVAELADPRLVWLRFRRLDEAIQGVLDDPRDLAGDQARFLLRELRALLEAEGLLDLATDRWGIAVGWSTEGAQRNDVMLVGPDPRCHRRSGPVLADIETLHMDRSYDARVVQACSERGLSDVVCPKRRPAGTAIRPIRLPLGMRWPVELANSWLSNFGQLRRNTDRRIDQRLGQFALAVALIIAVKLVKWAARWNR